MSLELILGPMFAGKSTEAIRRVRGFQSAGIPHMVITCISDTRYDVSGGSISTHSGSRIPATGVVNLSSACSTDEYTKASHIIIEEAQFFPDLYDVVVEMVEKRGKHVLVFGLDGDSERKPFGKIIDLIPLADTYTKLHAECRVCGNGTRALFTKRITEERDQVCVGGEESYRAVCRKHYLESIRV